jgi:hypothetical protein
VKHLLAKKRTRIAPAAQLAACAALFFSTALFSLRAIDLPPALTLNVPIAPNLATPAWLGHPNTPLSALTTLELPITAPDPHASLLVTVYFQENNNTFLRVLWKNTQATATIADNFYEDIGMANQRSLLIPPSTLTGDGTLIFEGGVTSIGIQRIKLEWLESREDIASPKIADTLVTPLGAPTVTEQSIIGAEPQPEAGAWDNDIVNVPLADAAVRIEQGVDFSIDLDKIPTSARVALKETGLPLGQHLVVWINEKRAGTITPSVPGLSDGGFFTDSTGATNYVGWRDGTFFIPVSLLKNGVNSLQFSPEDAAATDANPSTTTSTAPIALKALALQLNYEAPPGNAPDLPVLHLSATAAPIPVDDPLPSTPTP